MKRHLLQLAFTLLLVSTSRAYYQAEQGRWLNRDPIGEKGGINTYQFVNNSPFGNIDSSGLKRLTEDNIGEVQRGMLEYSCHCGWLDAAHLLFGYQQMDTIMSAQSEYESGGPNRFNALPLENGIRIGTFKTGLNTAYHRHTFTLGYLPSEMTPQLRDGLAMTMMLDWAYGAESVQDLKYFPDVGPKVDSSFSVEDMPSYYLGAMIRLSGSTYESGIVSLLRDCGAIGELGSKKVYSEGKDTQPDTNASHEPVLWKNCQCEDNTVLGVFSQYNEVMQQIRYAILSGGENWYNGETYSKQRTLWW